MGLFIHTNSLTQHMDTDATVSFLYRLFTRNTPVSTDSRSPVRDSVFFALKGESFDGNDFAAQALEAGCRYAVVDRPDAVSDNRCLLVHDVLTTLQQVSTMVRNDLTIPVIGITGSNGKTTTKELCHAVLSTGLHAISTKGNLNNHIGVPLTLLSLNKPLDIAIVEMGANHLKEIARLCELARPTHGVITNIGKAHLEGFGSPENVVRAKSELYDYMISNNGTLFVNGNDDLLMKLSDKHNRIIYGNHAYGHCYGQISFSDPTMAIDYQVNKAFGHAKPGMAGHVRTNLAGSYNFSNIMAAITIGLYFGIKEPDIRTALEQYHPTNHRSQLIKTNMNTVLMDAYNANPSSMREAIANFLALKKKGKTALFLGDMLELGDYSASEHREIADYARQCGFDQMVFVGQEFACVVETDQRTFCFPDAEAASQWLGQHPMKGFQILVKGSRGIRMETIIKNM